MLAEILVIIAAVLCVVDGLIGFYNGLQAATLRYAGGPVGLSGFLLSGIFVAFWFLRSFLSGVVVYSCLAFIAYAVLTTAADLIREYLPISF